MIESTPELERIARESCTGLNRYRPPRFGDIELDRPFVPESFTQLYHTPFYTQLDEAQRLCYNQLYGLRNNELFMLFEDGFTRRVITHLKGVCEGIDPTLGECLALMLKEESNHHQMFLSFNRQALPSAYHENQAHFAHPSRAEAVLLNVLTRRANRWPFMLWLILVLEEFSTAFSRLLMEREKSDKLAPQYVALHRLHLLDESRHIKLDAVLIERFLTSLSHQRQLINAWLFQHLFREMITPKRSGIRVLRTLVTEHPTLAPLLPRMEAAVRALDRDPGLYPIVIDSSSMPLTHGLFVRYPAFRFKVAS